MTMEPKDFKKGVRLYSKASKKYYIVEGLQNKGTIVRVKLEAPGKSYFYRVQMWRAVMIFEPAAPTQPGDDEKG
jgi:hypothetical protein